MDNSKTQDFFLNIEVEAGCDAHIEDRFKTLIESRGETTYDWYKALDMDKAYASRIRRGIVIPPSWVRIRIARYFGVDSSVLWKASEIVSANKLKESDEDDS